jgi:hypothetical protein
MDKARSSQEIASASVEMSRKKEATIVLPVDYTGLCERVKALEVKMNIIAFLSGTACIAAVATLFKLFIK